jgi:hypothetical protein
MDNVQIASRLDMVNMLVIEEFNEAWNKLHFDKEHGNNFEYNVNYNKIVGLDFDNWEFIVEFENITYKYRYFKDECISYRHFPLDLIYNKATDDWRVDLYPFVKKFVIDNRFNLNQLFWDDGKAIFEKWPDIKDEINRLEDEARKIYNDDVKQHYK